MAVQLPGKAENTAPDESGGYMVTAGVEGSDVTGATNVHVTSGEQLGNITITPSNNKKTLN